MDDFSCPVPSISEDEVKFLLDPYSDRLSLCFYEAWAHWDRLIATMPEVAKALDSTTRANFVNNCIWDAARRYFENDPTAHFTVQGRMRLLVLGERITIRFKKLHPKRLIGRNVQTQRQLAYALQRPIEGIPKLSYLTIGYTLDRMQLGIEHVLVTLPIANSVIWSFKLPERGAFMEIETSNFISVEETPARTRTVAAKRRDQTAEE